MAQRKTIRISRDLYDFLDAQLAECDQESQAEQQEHVTRATIPERPVRKAHEERSSEALEVPVEQDVGPAPELELADHVGAPTANPIVIPDIGASLTSIENRSATQQHLNVLIEEDHFTDFTTVIHDPPMYQTAHESDDSSDSSSSPTSSEDEEEQSGQRAVYVPMQISLQEPSTSEDEVDALIADDAGTQIEPTSLEGQPEQSASAMPLAPQDARHLQLIGTRCDPLHVLQQVDISNGLALEDNTGSTASTSLISSSSPSRSDEYAKASGEQREPAAAPETVATWFGDASTVSAPVLISTMTIDSAGLETGSDTQAIATIRETDDPVITDSAADNLISSSPPNIPQQQASQGRESSLLSSHEEPAAPIQVAVPDERDIYDTSLVVYTAQHEERPKTVQVQNLNSELVASQPEEGELIASQLEEGELIASQLEEGELVASQLEEGEIRSSHLAERVIPSEQTSQFEEGEILPIGPPPAGERSASQPPWSERLRSQAEEADMQASRPQEAETRDQDGGVRLDSSTEYYSEQQDADLSTFLHSSVFHVTPIHREPSLPRSHAAVASADLISANEGLSDSTRQRELGAAEASAPSPTLRETLHDMPRGERQDFLDASTLQDPKSYAFLADKGDASSSSEAYAAATCYPCAFRSDAATGIEGDASIEPSLISNALYVQHKALTALSESLSSQIESTAEQARSFSRNQTPASQSTSLNGSQKSRVYIELPLRSALKIPIRVPSSQPTYRSKSLAAPSIKDSPSTEPSVQSQPVRPQNAWTQPSRESNAEASTRSQRIRRPSARAQSLHASQPRSRSRKLSSSSDPEILDVLYDTDEFFVEDSNGQKDAASFESDPKTPAEQIDVVSDLRNDDSRSSQSWCLNKGETEVRSTSLKRRRIFCDGPPETTRRGKRDSDGEWTHGDDDSDSESGSIDDSSGMEMLPSLRQQALDKLAHARRGTTRTARRTRKLRKLVQETSLEEAPVQEDSAPVHASTLTQTSLVYPALRTAASNVVERLLFEPVETQAKTRENRGRTCLFFHDDDSLMQTTSEEESETEAPPHSEMAKITLIETDEDGEIPAATLEALAVAATFAASNSFVRAPTKRLGTTSRSRGCH